jgi:hypothetical protein
VFFDEGQRHMGSRAALMLGLTSLVAGGVFAGGESPAGAASRPASTRDARVAAASPQSELTALRQIKWTPNVSVSQANGSWTFRSDGIPSSSFTASHYAVPSNPLAVSAKGAGIIATSRVLTNQNYSFAIPTTPEYAAKTTTNLGAIGVMLDGAVLYNPYEANKSTVATHDNFSTTVDGTTASFLDTCDGHPGPGGQYHYHGLPDCLVEYATSGHSEQTTSVASFSGPTTAAVTEDNPAAKKPVLVGFAFDGYGIYDNVAMNGRTIPVSSLDACNGLVSKVPGYPHGIYHYVLENVKTDRSSIDCYHGVVSAAYIHALRGSINAITGDGPPGGPPAGRPGGPGPAQGLTARSNGKVVTAETMAANHDQVALLTDQLKALGLGGLC